MLRQLQGQRAKAVDSGGAVCGSWQVGWVGTRAQAQPHMRHQLVGGEDADLHSGGRSIPQQTTDQMRRGWGGARIDDREPVWDRWSKELIRGRGLLVSW